MSAFVAIYARCFRFLIIFGRQRMPSDYINASTCHQCQYMQETSDFDPWHPRDQTKRRRPEEEWKGG